VSGRQRIPAGAGRQVSHPRQSSRQQAGRCERQVQAPPEASQAGRSCRTVPREFQVCRCVVVVVADGNSQKW